MIAELAHIPLSEAFLCLDCDAVGNCGSSCAKCGSVQVFPVQRWLDRKPKKAVKR